MRFGAAGLQGAPGRGAREARERPSESGGGISLGARPPATGAALLPRRGFSITRTRGDRFGKRRNGYGAPLGAVDTIQIHAGG